MQIVQLKAALHIDCNLLETSKIFGIHLYINLWFSSMINETRHVCYFKLHKLNTMKHFLS